MISAQQGWQLFLVDREWHHVLTMTSRYPRATDYLLRHFRESYVRGLSRITQGPIMWMAVAEITHSEAHYHLHAVTFGTQKLQIPTMRKAWRLGYTLVTPYEGPEAIGYLTKSLGESHDGWDFSRRLPPKTTY